MDALISGEAGVALLVDGADLRSFGLGAAAQPIDRRREEVPFLLGDARDLQVLENVTEHEVALRLEQAATRVDGLQLILILLDSTLTAETRQHAAAEAEELLSEAKVAEAAESILYAHPLPDADVAGALSACADRAPRAMRVVNELVGRQPVIASVRQAWDLVPLAVFGGTRDRDMAQATFVREGLFRSLVLLREARRPIGEFLVDALKKPQIKALVRHRSILRSWIKPFQLNRKKRRPKKQRVETADVVAEHVAPGYADRLVSSLSVYFRADLPPHLGREAFNVIKTRLRSEGYLDPYHTEEVFSKALGDAVKYLHRHGDTDIQHPRAWFRVLCRRVGTEYLTEMTMQTAYSLNSVLEGDAELSQASPLSEERSLEIIRQAIAQLPPRYHQLITLDLIESLPPAKIQKAMQLKTKSYFLKLKSEAFSALRRAIQILIEEGID
jgi:DNA-directed RNA polymerase specialized sigma24 family protein